MTRFTNRNTGGGERLGNMVSERLLDLERALRRGADREPEVAADLQAVTDRQKAGVAAVKPCGGRHSSGQRAMKQQHCCLLVEVRAS